jgi:hypothetical protein
MDLLITAKEIADRVEAESLKLNVPVAVTVIGLCRSKPGSQEHHWDRDQQRQPEPATKHLRVMARVLVVPAVHVMTRCRSVRMSVSATRVTVVR